MVLAQFHRAGAVKIQRGSRKLESTPVEYEEIQQGKRKRMSITHRPAQPSSL
jgi:hypothetical protein